MINFKITILSLTAVALVAAFVSLGSVASNVKTSMTQGEVTQMSSGGR